MTNTSLAGLVSAAELEVEIDLVDPKLSSGPPAWSPQRGWRFGKYELVGRLATGGMAEIYLARDRAAGGAMRIVVLKVVHTSLSEDKNFIALFRDEGTIALHLNHPHIAHVYEFGRAEDRHFLAMEWIEGQSLALTRRRFSARDQRMPVGIAVKIVAEVADALEHAHRARDSRARPLGIVHRDVSPQNIMLRYDGVVKLLDFGVAKARSRLTTTQAGVVRGKFAYMSPQQCLGLPVDGRSDVFSLGVVLFELLTGVSPYERGVEFETMKAIIEGPVPELRAHDADVPPELEAIVTKALAKKPEDRFPTAGAMQEALEEVLFARGENVRATHIAELMHEEFAAELLVGPSLEMSTDLLKQLLPWGSIEPAPKKPARRRAFVWAAISAGLSMLVALAIALGVWIGTDSEPPPIERPRPEREAPEAQHRAPPVAPEPAREPPAAVNAPALRVQTVPAGARVWVDDREVEGTTPLDVAALAPGRHHVLVRLDGYHAHRATIESASGITEAIDVTLQEDETAAPGTLAINTRPWTKVYVGGRLLGTTPIGRARVPSGTVRLRLVDERGHTYRRTVRVAAGGHENAFYDLGE